MTTIQQLNAAHGIGDRIRIVEGAGGLPFIRIDSDEASAVISLYAGQVLSFQPANDPDNLMFLSEAAYYQPGKAIKGGAPVCWPWFGPDPEGLGRPAHGFVRNRYWNLVRTGAGADGELTVTLGLTDTEETRAIWPHAFDLALEIGVGASLRLSLVTRNTGTRPFQITQALHTYFRVGDIDRASVLGLDGLEYVDKTDHAACRRQEGAVSIATEVDRIYRGVRGELVIDDVALDRRIRIASQGSRTAVVWNPWARISAEMADLKDDDYRRFLCVETANADVDAVQVAPGGETRLTASYRVERDLPHVLQGVRPPLAS